MSDQYGGQWNTPPNGGRQPDQPTYPAPTPGPPGYSAGYGPAPAPGYGQPYGPGYGMAPVPLRGDYVSWGKRVGAYLIDSAPMLVAGIIFDIGYFMFLFSAATSTSSHPDLTTGLVPMVVGGIIGLAALGWQIYNRWIIAGRTGQSLGKRVTRIVLISEETNGPVGPLNAFLRDLVHTVDGLAYVGYLWPLWDEKRQTFADKLMRTIVIDAPQQAKPQG
jgi:uncharacterized RDD family membrane protein YckC